MFCSKCGKQIKDSTKFCPYCGNKITSTNMSNITDSVKKATDTAINTAKSAGNAIKESANSKVDSETVKDTVKKATNTAVNLAQSAKNVANEATNGQAEKYAERVKETAQSFVDDAKQVKTHEDVRNFYKKNNYRNLKICIILAIIIGGLWGVLSGTDKGEKLAKNIVSASYTDCKIKSVTKVFESDTLDMQMYVVKFIPSSEDEHSALVRVYPDNNFATVDDVYSKNRYNELDKEIESWKMVIE